MINDKKLEINLIREIHESEFYYSLLNEEFQKILYDKNLRNNNINIYTSYVYEDDENIEFGVYFINTSSSEVILNSIKLTLYNLDEIIHTEEYFINKNINSYSAVFKEIKIAKDIIESKYTISNLSIGIRELGNVKKYPYINIEIKNLPKIDDKHNYREIKKFIKNLPIIEENQICIDIFRVGEIKEGFFIIALFRNSSNNDVNIKSIPIEVENENNLLIYKGVFNVVDDSLNIEAKSGKIKVIVIPREDFAFIDGENFEKYNVRIV